MRRRDLLAAAAFAPLACARAEEPEELDVLVAGSGAAGLSAAIAALEAGAARVAVLEKGPLAGGHTLYSSGSVAAVSPRRQGAVGFADTPERFLADAMKVGGGRGSEKILLRIARESEAALDWLEGMGVSFGMPFTAQSGISPRCVAMPGNSAGRSYVMALMSRALTLGARVHLSMPVLRLRPPAVPGAPWDVLAEDSRGPRRFRAGSVVLATGGFTANVGRRMTVNPRLDASVHTSANPYGTNWDGAFGDGIELARGAGGAELKGFGLQLLPFWGGRLLDYVGGDIYVDGRGRRFVNEALPWSSVADAILSLPGRSFWVITDSKSYKGATLGTKYVNGIVSKSASVAEMAAGMGMEAAVLEQTLRRYNRAVRDGRDPDFGKTVFTQTIDKPPFYWGRETIYVHTTLDGVASDENAAVTDAQGRAIPGLFAAGETVGGIFGTDRLGGAGLANCFVMGRAAGRGAAAHALG